MYSKSQFAQVLEGLPRGVFERLVDHEKADKYSKGFRCWDQFIALVYGHLTGCKSLRELEAGFNAQVAHHYHLGTRTIKRSTLADANAKRSSDVFARACQLLIQGAHRKLKRELSDMLYLLDSTPIKLHGPGFDDWAANYKNHANQGLKLHMMIEANEATPVFSKITGMQVSDIKIGQSIPIEKNATYVFDKGYYDYNWWYSIDQMQSTFVTRLKTNANIMVHEWHDIPANDDHILEDATITFKNRCVKSHSVKNQYYDVPVRRITVHRPQQNTPMILVTNDFTRSASEVAALYKQRWGIELFFKWIKQNLRLKHFLGRNENAVKIQIYAAIISYLLLQIYQQKQGIKNSLKLYLSMLRVSLFQRIDTERAVSKRKARWRSQIAEYQPSLAF